MVLVNIVFDTNILIDYLNGSEAAKDEIKKHKTSSISAITWMEVMVGADTHNEDKVRAFLGRFNLIPIDMEISIKAVELRRSYHKLRLPDAIIWATAKTRTACLLTRNTKDFSTEQPDIKVPYNV